MIKCIIYNILSGNAGATYVSHERHLITPESGRNAQKTYQVRSTGVFLTSSHGVLFDYTWEIPPQDTGMDVNHSNANCACI